jgi:divalent metal cation (Fe/Co/Zn/Cd) transporter
LHWLVMDFISIYFSLFFACLYFLIYFCFRNSFSDVISLLIAYYANEVSGRLPTSKMTYGWRRSQILGGFTNSIFLLSLSGKKNI